MEFSATSAAQSQSEKGPSVEALLAKLLTSIIEGSITYGPYATFVTYLWLSERSERRECQKVNEALIATHSKEKDALNERVFKALNDATNSVLSTGQVLTSTLTTLSTVKDMLMGRVWRGTDEHHGQD